MAALEKLSNGLVPTLAVGGIVFNPEGRILLIKRGQPPAQGFWSIPGGKQEPNESLVDACVREVKEETGLSIEVKSLVAVVERRLEGFHFVIIDFLALPVSDKRATLTAGSDVTAACWVGIGQLPNYRLVEGLETILKQAHRIFVSTQPICSGLQATNKPETDFVVS